MSPLSTPRNERRSAAFEQVRDAFVLARESAIWTGAGAGWIASRPFLASVLVTREESQVALRVIKAADRIDDTASGAMTREAAISGTTTGAEHLWVGYVELPPAMQSAVHHHGESETAIYVIGGRARFASGDNLGDIHDATAGDFVWVGPYDLHVEINLSDTEPVRMVVARSTQEAIVVNVTPPEGWSPPT